MFSIPTLCAFIRYYNDTDRKSKSSKALTRFARFDQSLIFQWPYLLLLVVVQCKYYERVQRHAFTRVARVDN